MSCESVKPVVTVIFESDSIIAELKERCPSASFVHIKGKEITPEKLQDIEILLTEPFTIGQWVNYLPKLKWMQLATAGVDPIFRHLPKNGPFPPFVLTRLRGAYGPRVAEYVVGHIIARERNFHLSYKYQETKTWPAWNEMKYRVLSEITIGIIGFGEIGQEVARYCKSLKMTVHSIHRIVPDTKFPFVDKCFSVEDLPKCLKQCDYFCSVLPSTPNTVGLLSGNVLEGCKEKKSVFINVGRGDVISNESILKALDNEWIGGAILDVFEKEPLPKDSTLWTHPLVTVTTHCAGLPGRNQILDLFLENFELYKAGKPLKHVVDWKKGY